jgi:hypothetical protein
MGCIVNKKKVLPVIIVISIISVTGIFLGVFQPWNSKDTEIIFSHSEMLSYPGQTTWLLAKFISDTDYLMDVSVYTNKSIEVDFTIRQVSDYCYVDIFLYPNQSHLNTNILVTLSVTISNHISQESSIVSIVDWSSSLTFEDEEILNCFTCYLIENFTNFDQAENDSIEFMGNIPQILVVSHYLFRTENWEICLSKHVTIAPHDWVKIYLRSRDSFLPTYAWKIDSWSSLNHTIYEIDPPDTINR